MFGRITAFVYAVVCYFVFLAAFLYAIGFIANFAVPKSINSGPQVALTVALAIDLGLLALFALPLLREGGSFVSRANMKAPIEYARDCLSRST